MNLDTVYYVLKIISDPCLRVGLDVDQPMIFNTIINYAKKKIDPLHCDGLAI